MKPVPSLFLLLSLLVSASSSAQCYYQGCQNLYTAVEVINYPKVVSGGFQFDLEVRFPPCFAEYSGRIAVVKTGSASWPERHLDTVPGVVSPGGTTVLKDLIFPQAYLHEGFSADDSTLYFFTIKLLDNADCPEDSVNFTDPSPFMVAVYRCGTPITHSFSLLNCGPYTWNDMLYTTSGTFTQVLRAADGCDSTVTIDLQIDSVDTTVTAEEVSLFSNATGVTYQWIDCSTLLPIGNATEPLFAPAENGTYAVVVSNSNCTDTSACYTLSTIGMPGLSAPAFYLYPNPVSTALTVRAERQGVLEVVVSDLLGRVVAEGQNSSSMLIIELQGLRPGTYFARISDGQRTVVKKVVKE